MAYTPNPEWVDYVDGGTLISADALNHIEQGIADAHEGKADTTHQHPVSDLTATGTADETTYLRGDGAWATPESGGGSGIPLQYIPPVGNEFSSSFFISGASAHLRSGPATVMPLYIPEAISIDRVSFNIKTLSSAGVRAGLRLSELNGSAWTTLSDLATDIPLDDTLGVKQFTIEPIALTAGKVYGFHLFQVAVVGDFAVRVASGGIIGPGVDSTGMSSSWGMIPIGIGMNGGLSQTVPIIRVRRSA